MAAFPCPRRPLAADTPLEVEDRQIEGWRRMSTADKAALVGGLTNATFVLAKAGLRHRYPGASERELFLRLAVLTLGRELAERAYPDTHLLPEP
jgi:hypothetical protein